MSVWFFLSYNVSKKEASRDLISNYKCQEFKNSSHHNLQTKGAVFIGILSHIQNHNICTYWIFIMCVSKYMSPIFLIYYSSLCIYIYIYMF